jgi:hypothetical protein
MRTRGREGAGGVAPLNHRLKAENPLGSGDASVLSTWVFEGDSHVFAGFGDRAQGLTQCVSLKRGLFEVHLIFWQ